VKSTSRLTRWYGPGLVFALAVLGPGDFVANAAVGTTNGYQLLWALAAVLIFRFVWLDVSAKYVLTTGESLLHGYRRVGMWLVWAVLLSLLLFGHLTGLYTVVFMGQALDLLVPLPIAASATIWSLICVVVGFALMFWGGYPIVAKVFQLLIALMGGALIVAALLADPQPGEIVRGILVPSIPPQEGFFSVVLLLSALIGTEAGSVSNLSYSYFLAEQGWRNRSFLRRQRIDLLIGIACIFSMGALLQIAAAGIELPNGRELSDTKDLLAIFQNQGFVGTVIFALGIWSAAFSTFVGISTGYGLIVTDIYRSILRPDSSGAFETGEQRVADRTPAIKVASVDSGARPHHKDAVFRSVIFFWSFSPVYILVTDVPPVWLTLAASSAFAVMVPLTAFGLLRITNDRKLMGDYCNRAVTNGILVILIAVSLFLTVKNVVDLFK